MALHDLLHFFSISTHSSLSPPLCGSTAAYSWCIFSPSYHHLSRLPVLFLLCFVHPITLFPLQNHIHFHPSPCYSLVVYRNSIFCCFPYTCFPFILYCPASLYSITLSNVLSCFSLSLLPVVLHRKEHILFTCRVQWSITLTCSPVGLPYPSSELCYWRERKRDGNK